MWSSEKRTPTAHAAVTTKPVASPVIAGSQHGLKTLFSIPSPSNPRLQPRARSPKDSRFDLRYGGAPRESLACYNAANIMSSLYYTPAGGLDGGIVLLNSRPPAAAERYSTCRVAEQYPATCMTFHSLFASTTRPSYLFVRLHTLRQTTTSHRA